MRHFAARRKVMKRQGTSVVTVDYGIWPSLVKRRRAALHITGSEIRRLLGFETKYELDGFLKAHGVYEDLTMEDFERDLADVKNAGF